jgi:transposase
MVLSHSRKAYSEATFRQTTDDFIRCLENAFHYFGGVPQTVVKPSIKDTQSLASRTPMFSGTDP